MSSRVAPRPTCFGLAVVVCSGLLLTGCAGMSNTEQRVLNGATIGAVTGGLSIPAGAIIGAGAGAVTGLAVDLLKQPE